MRANIWSIITTIISFVIFRVRYNNHRAAGKSTTESIFDVYIQNFKDPKLWLLGVVNAVVWVFLNNKDQEEKKAEAVACAEALRKHETDTRSRKHS